MKPMVITNAPPTGGGAKRKWIPAPPRRINFAGMTKGAEIIKGTGMTKVAAMTKSTAFTLVELLVALMVASIIFGAVASLAFAVGSANDLSEDVSFKQAHIRQATLRLSELIRNSKLVTLCGDGDDLAVWRADDDLDNEIDPAELAYIEAGSARDHIYLVEFPGAGAGKITLADIISGTAQGSLAFLYDEQRAELIPQCSNVEFYPEGINTDSEFVSISFDIDEAGHNRHYQINAALRCRAEHLLSGSTIVSDDD